jgi:cephalosporin hydroxylase
MTRDFRTFFAKDQLGDFHKGVMRYRYRDVLCQKCPIDIAIYMRLIWDAKPRTIFEIGTKAGGSALLFRDLCALYRLDVRVVSIDLKPPSDTFDGIDFVQGDVLSLKKVFRRNDLYRHPRPWLVVEDSAHTLDACTAALDFFGKKLRPGEFLVIEDGVLNDLGMTARYGGGPNAAIAEYLAAKPSVFEIAASHCDMFGHNATYNPNGYLKKR